MLLAVLARSSWRAEVCKSDPVQQHRIRCLRYALLTYPRRSACFTDHAAARFCRTGKEKEDQDWEPEEEEPEEEEPQEEELDEEDLLEVRAKKGTKTKKAKEKTKVRPS